MKILISIDYEGGSGVVHWKEPSEFQRRMMTEDVIAIASGLKEHTLIITDAHAGGRNILPDLLPEHCELIRGGPRPLGMMEGVELVDGVILASYHGGIGLQSSVMDHTFSSRTIQELLLNGKIVNEGLINTYLAGYFKKPVIMVSGDDSFIRSIQEQLDPGCEFVVTKYGISRFSARIRPPGVVRKELKECAQKAVVKIDRIKPILPPPPYQIKIRLADTLIADLIELIPGVSRTSGVEIEFNDPDFLRIYKSLRLCLNLGIAANYYREYGD